MAGAEAGRRRGARLAWSGFFALVAAAWIALALLAAEPGTGPVPSLLGALAPGFPSDVWRALCTAAPAALALPGLVAMWALMALAMMLPTALPLMTTFREIGADTPGVQPGAGLAALVAGYAAVWLGFAVAAAGLQAGLGAAGLVTDHGLSLSRWLTAGLLLGAGAYQFSALKAACLSRCRAPMTFLLMHWQPGLAGAARLGARHGLDCLGCCWALMLLGFVGGTMNLAWMAGAMALMMLEKLPGLGARLTAPLGWLLIAAAVAVALGLLG